jgi:ribosomal protein S18 acetylase RimI-like enzyme
MIVRMALTVRTAQAADDAALAALDHRCWAIEHEVMPRRNEHAPFFSDRTEMSDVLVAEIDGEIAGWTKLAHPTPVASNAHVQQIQGLAVDPRWRRRGVGRALIDAACDLARSRGARRITLRVLGTNPGARQLYETAGFVVEGVLPGEFYLGGKYVDDIFMGRPL